MASTVHWVAGLIDGNAFLIDSCHGHLLEVALVGCVEWDVDLAVPELVGHLVDGGGIMGCIQTDMLQIASLLVDALAGTLQGVNARHTVMPGGGDHGQVERQLGGV